VLRIKTKAQTAGDNQEWLEYTFDTVTDNSATVNLRWEKVRVPFTVEVKDVKSPWLKRADEMIAANPTAGQLPTQVAQTLWARFKDNEAALKYVDQGIKIKETFGNLSLKSNILWDLGKKDEAQAVADAAIAKGKADKANTAAFEKRVADRTAAKNQ